MRNSFTSMPRAPMRGDTVAPKKAMGFGALAEERVAKQAQQKAPVQSIAQAAKPPASMQMPAQNKQMQAPQPMPKPAPGGMKPATQVEPDVRSQALAKFGARVAPTQAESKSKTDPSMAGQKPIRGEYVPPQVAPLVDRSGGVGYGSTKEDASGKPHNAGVTGGKPESTSPSKFQDKSQNPGPGYYWDSEFGKWTPSDPSMLPAGVPLDDPGWYYTEKDGWQHDPNMAGGEAIDAELAAALKGNPEDYGMSEELKAKAKQSLFNQAAQAKADLSQSMAGRGLGASGLTGAGFGQIDVGTQMALTDMEVQNWQAGVDARINELKTLLTARGNELSEKNRREIADQIALLEQAKFEDAQAQQDEADEWTALSNIMLQFGGEQWTPAAWSWALRQLKNGIPVGEIARYLKVGGGATIQVDSAMKDKDMPTDLGGEDMSDPEAGTGIEVPAPDGSRGKKGKSHKAGAANNGRAYREYLAAHDERDGEPLSYGEWLDIYGN